MNKLLILSCFTLDNIQYWIYLKILILLHKEQSCIRVPKQFPAVTKILKSQGRQFNFACMHKQKPQLPANCMKHLRVTMSCNHQTPALITTPSNTFPPCIHLHFAIKITSPPPRTLTIDLESPNKRQWQISSLSFYLHLLSSSSLPTPRSTAPPFSSTKKTPPSRAASSRYSSSSNSASARCT